jgi:D-serine deaminase-like pyridoxal phosphate-dependent protein
MKLSEIPTPALCVDIDAMRRNIETMSAFFTGKPCALRPHFKAHKTVEIAKHQAAAGAAGFCCATLGEAEVLAAHGFSDLLIANEILDPAKLDRLRALSDEVLVTVAVDSLEAVELLRDFPVAVLLDICVGLPRCGVAPEKAVELANAVAETEMQLIGVMGYEGHAMAVADPGKREHMARKSMAILLETAESLRAEGFAVPVVSAGGTGTYAITGTIPGVTEIQAGSYVLMDTAYARYGLPFEEALRCLATVLSVRDDIAVLDAGLKTLATDHGPPELADPSEATVLFLSDEHTSLRVDDSFPHRPGSRMWLRPSHVDPTVNLHDRLYAFRGEDVLDVWPVEARGYRA